MLVNNNYNFELLIVAVISKIWLWYIFHQLHKPMFIEGKKLELIKNTPHIFRLVIFLYIFTGYFEQCILIDFTVN